MVMTVNGEVTEPGVETTVLFLEVIFSKSFTRKSLKFGYIGRT